MFHLGLGFPWPATDAGYRKFPDFGPFSATLPCVTAASSPSGIQAGRDLTLDRNGDSPGTTAEVDRPSRLLAQDAVASHRAWTDDPSHRRGAVSALQDRSLGGPRTPVPLHRLGRGAGCRVLWRPHIGNVELVRLAPAAGLYPSDRPGPSPGSLRDRNAGRTTSCRPGFRTDRASAAGSIEPARPDLPEQRPFRRSPPQVARPVPLAAPRPRSENPTPVDAFPLTVRPAPRTRTR